MSPARQTYGVSIRRHAVPAVSSVGTLAAVDFQNPDPLTHEGLQDGEILILSSLPHLLAELLPKTGLSLICSFGTQWHGLKGKDGINA